VRIATRGIITGFQSLSKHFEELMVTDYTGHDGEPQAFKMLWWSNWNKDHVHMDSEHIIDANDNEWNDGEFGK